MITILTPTFNREAKLRRLYESLSNQTTSNFCWLVVDDGSTDNTEGYINSLIESSPFEIIYLKKDNGGKHTALNLGYDNVPTEWTLIVDSDDWLKQDCIEHLDSKIREFGDDYDAISFLRVDPNLDVIGDKNPEHINNYIDKIVLNISGDKAGIHRTSTAKKFKFPEYKGENFMSEMPFFLWFGSQYKTKFLNYEGYICEYQENGLSAKIVENRYSNIKSTLYVYDSMYHSIGPLRFRMRAGINWWRFKVSQSKYETERQPNRLLFPVGAALHILDLFK
ncbi:glycosyltransferase family 2 protein [Vibrio splendidus]